jgi:hypothetical protein
MKPRVIGDNAEGEPIALTSEDRAAHTHVIGASGSGKSKFLESLIRGDLANRQGFCLIDPHGSLYRDVLNYCAHKVLRRDIVLLNLSEPSQIIGFNPFARPLDGDVSVQVDCRISATMHAWGVENADETPTLERTLRLIYTTLIEQRLSFHHAQYLIDFNAQAIRSALIKQLTSPLVKKEWEELEGLRAKDFRNEVLSAKNRLFRLLTARTLGRFLNASGNCLDLADIMDSGKVLLVNLAPSDHFSAENARVFGALLVNEFFEVARRRIAKYHQAIKPYFLYLDEFQTFVSLDIVKMLDQVRKFGLFTILAHQRFGQLNLDLCDAVLTNCKIKAVFGGLPVESARMMAQELFIGELDPKKIKVAIYQTKFWPKYSRDKVYTRSTSSGQSFGTGENIALSSGSSLASGEFFQPHDWFSVPTQSSHSIVSSHSSSRMQGRHSNQTDFTGDGYAEADVPIMLPVPFQELSSVQFYSPEEQLQELTAALKEQFGRHCFIKIHQQKTQPMRVPFVKACEPRPGSLDWYLGEVFKNSNAIPAGVIDDELRRQQLNLEQSPKKSKAVVSSEDQEQGPDWSEFLGKE